MPRKTPHDWQDEDIRAIPAGLHPYNRSKNTRSTKIVTAPRNDDKLFQGRNNQFPRYSSSARVLSDDVVLLERNMRAWGVDPHKNQVHRTRTNVDRDIQPVKLPVSFNEAALAILNQEIQLLSKRSVSTEVIDRLNDENLFGPPYYFNVNLRRYDCREGFERFLPRKLDPFVRFTSVSYASLKLTKLRWSDEKSYCSTIFRALIGRRACHHSVQSVSCGSDSKLRWNLTTEYYPHWTRLVCNSCKSVYAMKSAASFATLEKKLLKRQVDGYGWIDTFYGIRDNLATHSSAKQYITLVCTENLTGPVSVFVGEVTKAEPQLQEISFIQDDAFFSARRSLATDLNTGLTFHPCQRIFTL
jgi:hypothetical protein